MAKKNHKKKSASSPHQNQTASSNAADQSSPDTLDNVNDNSNDNSNGKQDSNNVDKAVPDPEIEPEKTHQQEEPERTPDNSRLTENIADSTKQTDKEPASTSKNEELKTTSIPQGDSSGEIDSHRAELTDKHDDLATQPQQQQQQGEQQQQQKEQEQPTQPESTTNPPATPAPAPKTKKRLTLQERLALAAKGGKKVNSSTAPGAKSPSRAKSPSTQEQSVSPASSPAPESSSSRKSSLDTERAADEKAADSPAPNNTVSDEVAKLKAKNAELSEEVRRLKQSPTPISLSKEKKDLLAKIANNEETISQLMKEGEALSIKELKLNDTIKALKSTNNNLELTLREYSDKNDDAQIKLSELEDFLHINKFKSPQQLIDSYNDLNSKLSESNRKLEEEKSQNWESKYKEQQRLYEAELTEKKNALKQSNEASIKLDMTRSQASLDLGSKDHVINKLRKEMTTMKQEYSQEVLRLENKLEHLRIEHESGDSDSYKKKLKGDASHESLSSDKVIDYDEFAKLSQTHHDLQQQYISSQENWKIIESNLSSKVDSLTTSLDVLKKAKLKLSTDLKRLQIANTEKDDEIQALSEQNDTLRRRNHELDALIKTKDTEIQEANEKFEKFKSIYNGDRQKLETKIENLNEELNKVKELKVSNSSSMSIDGHTQPFVPPPSGAIRSLNNSGLHINIEPPSRSPMRTSSPSTESPTQTPIWQEIRVGESSTTPAIHKDFGGVFMNASHNNSSNSLNGNNDEDYSMNDDAFSFRSRYQNGANHQGSISGLLPSSGNNNIQLISKMSANIRRVEIELSTLKDENAALVQEKEQLQQELMKKLKVSDEVDGLKAQLEGLQSDIDAKSAKERTMLEVIGEKSEQVEELRADVQDLKDLCRQQVQQMIEMQESR